MPMNLDLKNQLLTLREHDQNLANLNDEEINKRYSENTETLKKIITDYGWPKQSDVGPEAVEAAWLISQHADHDLPFQEKCLELIEKSIDKKETPKHFYAYLLDRILINQGKKQKFGTQFYRDIDGKMKPKPIEDTDVLDELRASYNLPPLKQYATILNNFKR